MDELTMLVTALTSGAIAGSKDVATQAVKDSYAKLKKLITGHKADTSAVDTALKQVENKGELTIWKPALQDALRSTELVVDPEIVSTARELLKLLEGEGLSKETMSATVHGSGAIAQGTESIAAGKGGTAIGTVNGDVLIGK